MATPLGQGCGDAASRGRTRCELVLEILALRHQIAILERTGTRRPCFRPFDRLLWVLLSRLWPRWRDCLIIVQSETVLGWRRQGLGLIWRRGGTGRWRGGRPRVAKEIRGLISRMRRENPLWGAPRIHGELLKLGFTVSEATVSRYLRRCPRPRLQRWTTFVRNHLLLIPDRFDSVPEHGHRPGGDHIFQTSASLASEWRSPERGGPIHPALRQPEAKLRNVGSTGLKNRARRQGRKLELCLLLRPTANAIRCRVGIAHIRAPPIPTHPVSHAA